MLFSIIVPVYNVENYLEECIESIIDQIIELPNECELLLIDDGSTDLSGKICDRYGLKYPNIVKVFHNNNQGLLLTRRFGFKYASGQYFINCDSDDKLEETALMELKKAIIEYNYPDVILFDHFLYDGKEKKIACKDRFTQKNSCLVTKEIILKQFLIGHDVVSMWGKICKRECIDIEKDYSSFSKVNNGEDSLQSIEFFNNANTFVYLNRNLYNYRIGSGMTRKYDSNYFASFRIIIEEMIQQKNSWRLKNFDQLIAVKILATAGRAITQSRYNYKLRFKEERSYLKKIYNDDMYLKYKIYFKYIKGYLQKDHILLLTLINLKCYTLITLLLKMKNIMEYFE